MHRLIWPDQEWTQEDLYLSLNSKIQKIQYILSSKHLINAKKSNDIVIFPNFLNEKY
jgi:hypothetical protein